jgi:hypothetical protein
MQNSRNPNKRVTMIKNLVGKVRTASYALPGDNAPDFTYGVPNVVDPEGAGALQNLAEQSVQTKHSQVKCFPATNRAGLQNGCLTSKSQREFAATNPVMRSLNKPPSSKKLEIAFDESHVFGIKNVENDVPIHELLKSQHVMENDYDYPDLSQRQKKGRLPPSRSTKASRLLEDSIKKGCSKEHGDHGEKPFKMKRFLKVESKVKATGILQTS